MELVRWRPRRNLPSVYGDFDSMFDRLLQSWMSPVSFTEFNWNPSIDVAESDDEITVKAEIPGVSADDIDVSIDGSNLVISGEKKQESEEKDRNYYRVERCYGSFRRSIALPPGVDVDNIKASSKDGVLTVAIPKTEDKKSRKIKIKAN